MTPEERVEKLLDAIENDAHPEQFLREVIVPGLRRPDVNRIAADYLWEKFLDRQRARTLRIERDAERPHTTSELPGGARPRRGTRAFSEWLHTPAGQAWAAEEAAFEEEHSRRLVDRLSSIVDDFTRDLKIQWTEELLQSEFALQDGTRTTWGDATIAQHRERLAMFKANAQANIEGAARHQRAISDLEATGAANLASLTQQVAS